MMPPKRLAPAPAIAPIAGNIVPNPPPVLATPEKSPYPPEKAFDESKEEKEDGNE
jgi:hypothetical protein